MMLKHVGKTGCRWLHVRSVRICNAEAMEAFGAELAPHIPHPSTIFLVGNLGCGKTCLARGFVRNWTNEKTMQVTSPTYLLMNTYEANQKLLYHMDLYRLDKVSSIDATAMGLDDAFATSTNLIEWPDRLTPQLVPSTRLEIHIAYTDNSDERTIEFKYFGDIWNNVKQCTLKSTRTNATNRQNTQRLSRRSSRRVVQIGTGGRRMRRSGLEAQPGVLVKCDPPTKQYLKHLNSTPGQEKFIIRDLDETHLFIKPEPQVIAFINKKIDEWNDKNTYQAPTN